MRVKRQHFVPQCYLRSFSIGGRGTQVHVFDKERERTFVLSISDVASRRSYYDVAEVDAAAGEAQFLEKSFASFEGRANATLQGVIAAAERGTFTGLSAEERRLLAEFVALQWARTEEARKTAAQFWEAIPGEILSAFPQLAEAAAAAKTPEGGKRLHAEKILSPTLVPRVIETLLRRRWTVLTSTGKWTFFTSDDPVVHASLVPPSPHYGDGICSESVEVAIPLSPRVLLSILPMAESETVQCLEVEPDEVRRYNLMQIDQATAQIYASTGKFSLVERRIREHPDVRDPDRRRVVTNVSERMGVSPPE